MKHLLKLPVYGLATTMMLSGAGTIRAADSYATTVLGDHPLAYYRLADVPPPDIATNSGSLGTNGNGLYFGAGHRALGVLAADPNAAASFDGSGVRVAVPYTPALNPPASKPFTVEAWVLPTIDGAGNAQAPLFNRHSPEGANRQGWVFFQRGSTASSADGFNFRMYNENGSSQSIDITGGSYNVGEWTHLAATWDGTTATLYVNGVNAGSQAGSYVANSDAPFTIGAYGANNPGDDPFTGSIDEVAFYTNALSSTQIANHYNNALSASPSTNYAALVLNDGAVEYLRLNEASPLYNVAVNSGSIGAAGDGIHSAGSVHSVPGAIVGSTDTAIRYSAIDTNSDDGGVPTIIPYTNLLNPNGSFTVEGWLRPTENGNGNAQSPFFNRDPYDLTGNREGWDFFQRDSGTGWNFRMFNGNGHDKIFDITGGPYTVGQWCHLVAVYDATVPSATLYLNGVQVATESGLGADGLPFNPNVDSPLSIGSYSDGAQNPFVGDIDEFALYTNALTAAQVLAHYQNGINASRTVPYEQLVLADGAAEYLHLDEPAKAIVGNSGTAGAALNATYVNATNNIAGPQPPAEPGFDTNNLAAYFNSTTSYLEMGNPDVLNFDGPITLEAWILPDATENADAYIIAHGGNNDFSGEVALRIENGSYEVGSINAFATATIPDGDLGGGNWIHLAGTWDGTNWNLFRNGIQIATNADSTGPSVVVNANWAIGARGKWKTAAGFPFSGEDRVFSGGIDEAAIYGTALTPAQIAAHYAAGVNVSTALTAALSAGNIVVSWSTGTLQQSTNVAGPFADVPAATSPYSVPTSGASQLFFRLKL
jgi:hypothetical protein